MTNTNKEKKRGPFFKLFKSVLKIFKKKPEIINLNTEDISSKAILIANHSGAAGPFTYELFFPQDFVPWGTHEMSGNYKMRWNYLYHTFYQQKLHWKKPKAFIVATVFAVVSRVLYKAVGLIPTYTDNRLLSTIKQSIKAINEDRPVLIFPENSGEGYKEILEEYCPGFISLSKIYYSRTGYDLPVYSIYYSAKHNKIAIDKPLYVQDFVKQSMDNEQIAATFMKRTNELYAKYILHEGGTPAGTFADK